MEHCKVLSKGFYFFFNDLSEGINSNPNLFADNTAMFSNTNMPMEISNELPRLFLLTIHKHFVRPHLYYGDVIYDQPNNKSFIDKIESVQYDAALAITGAIRGTSRIKLYKELGLESLKDRRWMHRLFFFRKIFLPALLRIFLIPSHLKPFYKDIQTVLLVIVAEQFFFKIHFFLTW